MGACHGNAVVDHVRTRGRRDAGRGRRWRSGGPHRQLGPLGRACGRVRVGARTQPWRVDRRGRPRGRRHRRDGGRRPPPPRPRRCLSGQGDNHGFAYEAAVRPGTHQVCVVGLDAGPGENTTLDCGQVTVRPPSPYGVVDRVGYVAGGVRAAGWAIDPTPQTRSGCGERRRHRPTGGRRRPRPAGCGRRQSRGG